VLFRKFPLSSIDLSFKNSIFQKTPHPTKFVSVRLYGSVVAHWLVNPRSAEGSGLEFKPAIDALAWRRPVRLRSASCMLKSNKRG
ncbi:hypothetical protein PoB_000604800, partial [Plakobranchus ocellatus]